MKSATTICISTIILYACIGCSSLFWSQGYRLDSDSKTSELNDLCTSNGETYKGAAVSSSTIKMAINLDTRQRMSLLGPLLLPFIPISFSQDKYVSILVSTDLSGQRIQSRFEQWQLSVDGIHWLNPVEVKDVKFNSEGTYIVVRSDNEKANSWDTFAVQLIFEPKIKDVNTASIRTSEISLGGRYIRPFVSKWNRENYWSYTPFIGGMDGHFSSMMDCKR